MTKYIGIRREEKNRWERRTPLVPEHIRELAQEHGLKFIVQASDIRAYSRQEYEQAGALVSGSLADCPIIFAIKEIQEELIEPDKTYIFFSHTIKGQAHNIPLLKKILDSNCQLIDYEKITDAHGRRLIAFGRFAGLAGIIDTLWVLGQRLDFENIPNPFSKLRQAHKYADLKAAEAAIATVAATIKSNGLDSRLTPLIIGIAGYGNVSRGAQEILELLGAEDVAPEEIISLFDRTEPEKSVYKVVFKEEDTVVPRSSDVTFQLQDFFDHPEKYRGIFAKYLPYLTILVNAVYWDTPYPRLVRKEDLRRLYAGATPRLRVIGDISCDIEGAIECTTHATDPDEPVFTYDPQTDETINGVKGRGPVVLAVDNLPCELPKESSTEFSAVLKDFLPSIAATDFSVPFESCNLPPEIKRATIVYNGKLTPDFQYLKKYL